MNELQSVFISYGGPDRDFAERLHSDLTKRGAESFIFSKNAHPGTKLHRVMREGVNECDRVILICSINSLNRPGVLNEIEEVLQREAREGGTSVLIPVILDEFLFKGWRPDRQDIALAVQDRVVADFTGAIDDHSVYDAAFDRLMRALRPVASNSITKLPTPELSYDLLQSAFVQHGAAEWEPDVLRLGLTYGLLIESPTGVEFTSHFLGILCRDAAAVSEKVDLANEVLKNELSSLISIATGYAAASSEARDRSKFTLYEDDAKVLMMKMPVHVIGFLLEHCSRVRFIQNNNDGFSLDNEAFVEAVKLVARAAESIAGEGQLRAALFHAYADIARARLMLNDKDTTDLRYLLALVCVGLCEGNGLIDEMHKILEDD